MSLPEKVNVIRHSEAAEHQFYILKAPDLAGLKVQSIFKNEDKIKEFKRQQLL
jgi:hypothetical protein